MKDLGPVEFARRLRQTRTSSEEWLWQLLRNRQRLGVKFRRQHPLSPYTVDFYCHEAHLVIEVDGEPHNTPEGREKDKTRDAWMQAQGIEVLRFGGFEVENETQKVLERIDSVLRRRCARFHAGASLPSGEGLAGEGERGASS